MNKKRNQALAKTMYQLAVHIQNAYGVEEADGLDDFFGEGDRVAFDYIYKLFICFLKALGIKKWSCRFKSYRTLLAEFNMFLKEFGITYRASGIYHDTVKEVIFPDEDEEYRKDISEQLDELDDPVIKDIIMDQLVNWTHESGSLIDEDLEFRTWILCNADFIFIEIDRELSEQFSIYMENAAPSALAWYIGKKETETSVTYIYMGAGETVSEEGCSFCIESIEMFNLTFFFPLIEYMNRKLKKKRAQSNKAVSVFSCIKGKICYI